MYFYVKEKPYKNIFYQKYLIEIFENELKWKKVACPCCLKNMNINKIFSTIDEYSFINNEIDYFWIICHKASMAKILEKSNYIPKTYIIENNSIINFNEKNTYDLWYLKKNNSGRGKDVFILSDFNNYKNIIKNSNDTWILQKTINPLLIDGCKFHIRHSYLITRNNNKLNAYIYNDFHIIKNKNKYKHILDRNLQLTHFSRDTCENIKSDNWDYKNTYLVKIETIMKDISKQLLINLEKYQNNNKNAYNIFGLDIMLDNNYNIWLLEINYGAAFSIDNYKLNLNIFRDLINLCILPSDSKKKNGWIKI